MTDPAKALVLVADDSPFQRDFVAAALQEKGYRVVTAENGLDAMNRVYEHRPEIVVSDVMMPELSGYQFCRILKNDAAIASTPVILLTSLAQQRDRFWGRQAGADRYVIKDESIDVVVNAVGELLEEVRRRGRGPGAAVPAANLTESAAKTRLGSILETLLFEATVANRVRDLFRLASAPADLAGGLFDFLRELFRFQVGALLVRSPRNVHLILDLEAGIGRAGARDIVWRELQRRDPTLADQPVTWTLRGGEERSTVFPVFASKTVAPVKVGDREQGLLLLLAEDATALEAEEKRVLAVVLRELASVLSYLATHAEMEAVKADFMSMIVHDLRSPLAGILAGTEILTGGLAGELSADQKQIVDILSGSSRRLMGLVNEVLDMSRIEAGRLSLHREIVSPGDAVRRAVEESRFIAGEKSQNLKAEVPEGLPPVDADREKIEQVLLNLVTNAVKFTPVKGSVTVRAALDRTGGKRWVRFEVADTGPGLNAEEQTKLFQKYSELEGRKKAELKGTGLGLFICKSIVEAHGGVIGAESEPGKGSTFHFRIPAVG